MGALLSVYSLGYFSRIAWISAYGAYCKKNMSVFNLSAVNKLLLIKGRLSMINLHSSNVQEIIGYTGSYVLSHTTKMVYRQFSNRAPWLWLHVKSLWFLLLLLFSFLVMPLPPYFTLAIVNPCTIIFLQDGPRLITQVVMQSFHSQFAPLAPLMFYRTCTARLFL